MLAAVFTDHDRPLDVRTDVDVVEPGRNQVLVDVVYCGICHSDLHMGGGATPVPLIAGHEASGVVEAVGEGVDHVAPGDHVVLTPTPSCGRCRHCTGGHPTLCVEAQGWMSGVLPDGRPPFVMDGAPLYRGNGVGAWAERTVVSAHAVVKIDADIPLDIACLIGCAVQTGVGAVLNTAQVSPGASVLVMGLGGVGQSVIQGARIAGASVIIASDPVPDRRDAALRLGATTVLDPSTDDVVRSVRSLCGGVDVAFDVVGMPELVALGVRATAPGGAVVLVGAPKANDTLSGVHHAQLIAQEKRLLGSMVGSSNAARDFPRLLQFYRSGALDLDGMISACRPLREINEGLDDLRAGRGVRTVLSCK